MTGGEHTPLILVRRDLQLVGRCELRGERLVIGRAPNCEIRLDDPSVSRYHAHLEQRGDGWHVVDDRSTNGVLLNGRRVQEAAIRPGDCLEVRPFVLEYAVAGQEAAEPSVALVGSDGLYTSIRIPVAGPELARQRLGDLYALARLVMQRRTGGSPWPTLEAAMARCLSANRCLILGISEAMDLYPIAPATGEAPVDEPLNVSRSIVREVVHSRESVLVERVANDDKFARAVSLAETGTQSVLCAPIIVRGQPRAIIYADRRRGSPAFGREDLEYATAAADLAAAAAELDDLQETARELARLQGRIEAGREIQQLLLPSPVPQPAWGEVAAANYPAERMSGDIHDVIVDSSGRLLVMLADVCGKGVPAAILTAILHNTLRLSLAWTDDLADIMRRLNASLVSYQDTGTFATLVLCRWTPDGGRVEVANAGHPPPIWLWPDGSTSAGPARSGLPLGIDAAWQGESLWQDLADEFVMMLYSDGASEARSPADEEYGVGRLTRLFAAAGRRPPGQILETVAADVRAFCSPADPADDLTLLVAQKKVSKKVSG